MEIKEIKLYAKTKYKLFFIKNYKESLLFDIEKYNFLWR